MKFHLTPDQTAALQKVASVTLGALITVSCFLAVPRIASAIPSSLAERLSAEPPMELLAALRTDGTKPAHSEPQSEEPSEAPVPPELSEEPGDVSVPPELSEPPEVSEPPEGAITVFSDSYCWYEIGETPTLNLLNGTSFRVNLKSYLEKNYPIAAPDGTQKEPLVLVMHTHGSECYLPDGIDYYLPGENFRSQDASVSVIAVGETVAETLDSMGIPTVHDKTIHDKSFNNAYTYARQTIEAYLKEYPSIQYVLDIHRDSIRGSDGIWSKTLTTVDGTPSAQIMLVVGTNQNGAAHPAWQQNLTVATHLQDLLGELSPTLARPINLRADAFNQWVSTGALLVEVGSCGNTVEEAKTAGRLFATAFGTLIKQKNT